MKNNTLLRAVLLTGAIYGGAGWVYIAGNAVFHPETLPLPLTHLLPFPREDTFGAVCFATSVICFCGYQVLFGGKGRTKK